MLKRTPSLAFRAGFIFMSVYISVFVAVLMLIAALSLTSPEKGDHGGAVLALEYAAHELKQSDDRIGLSRAGRFAALAAKNPSMWLIAQSGDRSFSFGTAPRPAVALFKQFGTAIDAVQFRVPGVEMPLGVGALERHSIGSASVLLAAGGIDPATLTVGDSLRLFLDGVTFAILGLIAVITLVAMLIAIPFFSRALRPITAQAGAIRPQDAGRRLDERRAPRELLPLVRGFNAALDRLEVELGRRKRFIADVAHELRTPLAVAMLRVEALEDHDAREELTRAVGRLTHLVTQMLDLERLSLSSQQHAELDLVRIAADVVADLAPMAINSGYDLSLDAPDMPAIVTGDPHAIARAITNLISNSIAHGGGAGQIRVVIGEELTIDVMDEGPGVPALLQPRLFEPFCRGNLNTEGSGLGLHLTREILRSYGGDARQMPTARGAQFRLTFAPSGKEALS